MSECFVSFCLIREEKERKKEKGREKERNINFYQCFLTLFISAKREEAGQERKRGSGKDGGKERKWERKVEERKGRDLKKAENYYFLFFQTEW